ncbi:MAG: hypothetical protein H6577_04910 [Lewinellaceae bacterium]|nr:hypothetical protein [Lewinellaceae bacterium]
MKKHHQLISILLALPFLFFCFQNDALAQKLNPDHFKNIKPRNIGPAGMSGRVTAIDVVLARPDVIYIGAASGGVWRSASGGIDWEPVFDEAPVQSIGSIKINQRNPSEIWVGTGEGNPRNSQNSGEGIYKTIDGGKSWRKVLFVNDSTGCADLVVDPTNPNKLIAALWEYGRKPWTFNSGGPGSGLYVSYDAGETWERRTDKDGLPKGDLGRIGLAIAPSKPNIVYALVEARENALYKSTDGGFKWQKMASADNWDDNVSNRSFYYHELYVDPTNENRKSTASALPIFNKTTPKKPTTSTTPTFLPKTTP